VLLYALGCTAYAHVPLADIFDVRGKLLTAEGQLGHLRHRAKCTVPNGQFGTVHTYSTLKVNLQLNEKMAR
jgi:hypothetical protein